MNASKLKSVLTLVTSFLLATPGMVEGQLAPPAAPSDPGSARFSLNDVWSRLSTGATGALRTGVFAEPAAGPTTPTTKTTNEVMAAAPAADNVAGATAADVALGKTFWGLRTSGGTWGLTTGTATGGGTYTAAVEKTGQSQCYDASNVLTTCPGTPANQDGALQKGVAWPNPRFTDNGNGTVTDNLTGLIWLKNADCFGYVNWAAAMTHAASLASGTCGLTDGSTAGQWRLPNVNERLSLIHYGYYQPALPNAAGTGQHTNGDPFTSVQIDWYWSSSTNVAYPTQAWFTSLGVGGAANTAKTNSGHVWPVRDGQ